MLDAEGDEHSQVNLAMSVDDDLDMTIKQSNPKAMSYPDSSDGASGHSKKKLTQNVSICKNLHSVFN